MCKINKTDGYIVQHREYSQCFIITTNGVYPLKIVNQYVAHLKHIILYIHYTSTKKFKKRNSKDNLARDDCKGWSKDSEVMGGGEGWRHKVVCNILMILNFTDMNEKLLRQYWAKEWHWCHLHFIWSHQLLCWK